uniref:NADH dehydrogenase subunit 6 n=1 Tax=Amblyomma naponense TaxID=251387 RepID=UPI002E79AE0A|nr:NADH dehydrogenase subunit 6 [Amblyomma naponense]WQF69002.1 NADH dehydrogenase subunit 6 [Amblyomma naponense]
MKMILFISIILISMSHPMTMLISVILLTMLISFIFYELSLNSLIPMIMILLILGGMLILFMYMVSLCPNKKMNFNLKYTFFVIMMYFISIPPFFSNFMNKELTKIYSYSFMNMLLLMMVYLLITLTVVMKNLNWISSPMKMN